MKGFYKIASIVSVIVTFFIIVGYYFIIPFLINNILVPFQAYQSYSVYIDSNKENSIDEDFIYFDKLGNKIIICNFKKNISNIDESFFIENLSGEMFYESTDSINDKFEFKIVEFNKIDSIKYKVRVRKSKIHKEKQINLNDRKYLNYFLELEKIENKLKIKKCNLINIELN